MKSNRNLQVVSGFVAPAFFAGVVSPTNKGLSTMNEIIQVSPSFNASLLEKYASRVNLLFSGESLYGYTGERQNDNAVDVIYNEIRAVAHLVESLPISHYENSDHALDELGLTPELKQAVSNAKQAVSSLAEALNALSNLITEQAIAICPENYEVDHDCFGASCGYCY
jgi:hypothetical protein